jgi:hypothetical protein
MSPVETSKAAQAALDKLTQRELSALRTQLRRELRDELREAERTRRADARRQREVEPDQLAAAAKRMVRALGKRARADLEALTMLAELPAVVEAQLVDSIAAARRGDDLAGDHRYSWADVGRALGVTRQAAQMRYGK